MTYSSSIFLFSLLILFLPIYLVRYPTHKSFDNVSRISWSRRVLFPYILFTQLSIILLSLRQAGGDSARYADLYFFCSNSDFRLLAGFWDFISLSFCLLSGLFSNHSFFLFLHFYTSLSALFLVPVLTTSYRQHFNVNFYKFFPALCAFSLVLGYFTSPMRHAGASALVAFAIYLKSRRIFFASFLLHWSSLISIIIYVISLVDLQKVKLLLSAYLIKKTHLLVILFLTTSSAFPLIFLPPLRERLYYYCTKIISLYESIDTGGFGSINISKLLILLLACFYGFFLLKA